VELVAKTIYDTWGSMPGYVPWVAGGNSDRQIDARLIANRIINTAMEAHADILAKAKTAHAAQAARIAELEREQDESYSKGLSAGATQFAKLHDRIDEATARAERLEAALREIKDLEGEINTSNYDHDDACELNRQFCYAVNIADAALSPAPSEGGDDE
jgi:septal ring factor EnvC (AmiA/AmiB activator)